MGIGVGPAFKPLTPEDPREIAEYRLLARLGEGGMGTVYLSYTRGGQPVALKLIRREYGRDASFRHRFAQEVAAARRVKGYHLVPVVDFDTTGELPWLASEYVPGIALDDALAAYGPLPLPAVFQLVGCAAQALAAIHTAGVVHRDVKPSNIMLTASGPCVIDFGIARAADATRLTTAGRLVGTPQYMSPEHALGEAVGPAGDLFSLGLVAAVAATGRHPYGEGGGLTVATQIANTAARPPDLSGYPAPLRTLLERCLTASPDERITPDEVTDICERSAGRALRDFDGWLPKALTEAIAHRTAGIPGPPSPSPASMPGTGPPPPGPVTVTAPGSAPGAAASGGGESGGTPPVRPESRKVSARTVRAVTIAGVMALGLLLLSPAVAGRLWPDGSDGQHTGSSGKPSLSSQEPAGDDESDRHGGDNDGASGSPPAKSPASPYVPIVKDRFLALRAPIHDEAVADLDIPQVSLDDTGRDKHELIVTTMGGPDGWHFSQQVGISEAKTPEACLRGFQDNALPVTLAFVQFRETIPVGTLLCIETTEGNLAMLEITALAPAVEDYGGFDVSTQVTVWKRR